MFRYLSHNSQEKCMSKLGNRIREVLLDKGLSQAELARLIGVKQQTVSYICAPDSPATISRYTGKIAEALGVNPKWLQTGKGGKYDPIVRIEIDGEELCVTQVPLFTTEEVLNRNERSRKMPIRGLMTDANVSSDAFAFEVNDESMSPKLLPGDRVVIDPKVSPVPGDYVAAQSAGKLLLRRFRSKEDGLFELVPLNEDWPVIGNKNAKILGVMTELRCYRKQK